MNRNLLWIYFLVIQLYNVTSRPVQDGTNTHTTGQEFPYDSGSSSNGNKPNNDEKVISVRITSSVAVGRGTGKPIQRVTYNGPIKEQAVTTTTETAEHNKSNDQLTHLPLNLRGANIEFLKQLNAKKEPKQLNTEHGDHLQTSALRYDDDDDGIISYESKNDRASSNEGGIPRASKILSSDDFKAFRSKSISILDEALKLADERSSPHSTADEKFTENKPTENAYLSTLYEESEFNGEDKNNYSNLDYNRESKEIDADDSIAESSIKSVLEIASKHSEDYENIENVPLARSLVHSPSSKNYIQGLNNKPPSERESSTRLTTISFNIVHDAPKNFNDPGKPYLNQGQSFQEQNKFYQSPTIYSRPAQIYSEPAKVYSEPAKVYSEPAKIYSEPAKIYSEPAKIYSEPAKFYSEPASLHLKQSPPSNYSPWQQPPSSISTTTNTTPVTTETVPESGNTQLAQQQSEKNYEVDEKVSVLTDGRSHGEQETSTEKCKQENCKVGYVVKGRQFNKYRVEERTSDGFIVGEYGVVRNEDGALRGVRYTADSEASPRLIYDALMKFLQLK